MSCQKKSAFYCCFESKQRTAQGLPQELLLDSAGPSILRKAVYFFLFCKPVLLTLEEMKSTLRVFFRNICNPNQRVLTQAKTLLGSLEET